MVGKISNAKCRRTDHDTSTNSPMSELMKTVAAEEDQLSIYLTAFHPSTMQDEIMVVLTSKLMMNTVPTALRKPLNLPTSFLPFPIFIVILDLRSSIGKRDSDCHLQSSKDIYATLLLSTV